jgi:UDP-N-acetylenolpyruvoylglucosamine reductase
MSGSAWMLGACGMGVGPLALYLKGDGWDVSGWDDSTGSPMELQLANGEVPLLRDPWAAGRRPSVVGRSSAVKPGHPALALAEQHGVRTLRRGELLAEAVAERRFVAVCGSHGKTTTCGLLVAALASAGADFGYVLGGLFRDPSFPPARASATSPWVVAEVDESDGTIGAFSPDVTVAVNLDWDHPDYYRDEAALEAVFRALFERTRSAVVIPAGNARLERLVAGLKVPILRVGEDGDYVCRLMQGGHATSVVALGGRFPAGQFNLPVAGTFNRSNAALALAVTHFITGGLAAEPLARWRGIRRRQDVLFERTGLRVLADYAHHPTEIAALLQWVRETHAGRLLVVFQPHRHTRTRQYVREFRDALAVADQALVLPVYSAGEVAVEGGGSDAIVAGSAHRLVEDRRALPALLDALAEGADTVVAFVGAGDIERDAEAYAKVLRRRGEGVLSADLPDLVAGRLSVDCVLRANEPLARRTTLGLGGAARWYAEPASVDDLVTLLRAAAELDLRWFVLGRGSNLLVPDEGYDGLILHLDAARWGAVTDLGDGRFRVGGGTRLKELCGVSARAGRAGFEFLEGIPGTVGGSLRMNAGAMGGWIFDVVESIEWLTPQGRVRAARRDCFDALYRDCPQLHGAVVLSAVLRSSAADEPVAIRGRMDELAARRRVAQPREASAGCVFRNPEGDKAGRLIDLSGLKGRAVGPVSVSPTHANFLVNAGEAKAADFLALMRAVRAEVKARQGVELQPEIVALGREWKDLL